MHLQSDNNIVDQYTSILNMEIPNLRKQLKDNVFNLEKVAQYCEDIYVNSKDVNKLYLLNETKSLTTQALASVAYQINMLATNYLNVLDNQTQFIDQMNFDLEQLTQEISIHKEKVARREIGALTTNKNIQRTVKVKLPDVAEKPVKYIRKPIDYSQLDDIGHGVKLNSSKQQEFNKQIGRQNSYSSTHSSGSDIRGAPTTKPPTPPLAIKSNTNLSATGTVRSTQSTYYRTPVIPPSVPTEYLSRQELGIYSSNKDNAASAGAGAGAGAGNTSNSYGGPMGYYNRRPSQMSNEYSGMDTLDKRLANTYISSLNNSSTNNSVGYATGMGISIKTNFNNIDYATNGTLYRRPQLQNSNIYSKSQQQQQQQQQPELNQNPSLNQYGTLTPSTQRSLNLSSNGGGQQSINLPPPPEFFNNNSMIIQSQHNAHNSTNNINNENFYSISDNIDDFDTNQNNNDDNDVDDDLPDWVPRDRCIEKVLTTFDYEGVRDDELSFKENTFIYVIKKNDDNWYEGIMLNERGQICTGLYPFNYAKCVRKYMIHMAGSSEC